MNDLTRLQNHLRDLCRDGVALGFSGGVDSALLLAVLVGLRRERPFPLLVLTMNSPLQSGDDADNAVAVAKALGAEVEFFDIGPLAITGVRSNAPERCYCCKKAIFSEIFRRAQVAGISVVIDGTHAGDLTLHRPGQRALKELGVVSPLADLGLKKEEIRTMARMLDVPCSDRPASPCLATRFETGVELKQEELMRVGRGEAFLRKMIPVTAGFRLRVHGRLARIEVPPETFPAVMRMREDLCRGLHDIGYELISLDLDGLRSGSMDHKKP